MSNIVVKLFNVHKGYYPSAVVRALSHSHTTTYAYWRQFTNPRYSEEGLPPVDSDKILLSSHSVINRSDLKTKGVFVDPFTIVKENDGRYSIAWKDAKNIHNIIDTAKEVVKDIHLSKKYLFIGGHRDNFDTLADLTIGVVNPYHGNCEMIFYDPYYKRANLGILNTELVKRWVDEHGIDRIILSNFYLLNTYQRIPIDSDGITFFNGWTCDLSKYRRQVDLPEECQYVIEHLEKSIGLPVTGVQVNKDKVIFDEINI